MTYQIILLALIMPIFTTIIIAITGVMLFDILTDAWNIRCDFLGLEKFCP